MAMHENFYIYNDYLMKTSTFLMAISDYKRCPTSSMHVPCFMTLQDLRASRYWILQPAATVTTRAGQNQTCLAGVPAATAMTRAGQNQTCLAGVPAATVMARAGQNQTCLAGVPAANVTTRAGQNQTNNDNDMKTSTCRMDIIWKRLHL